MPVLLMFANNSDTRCVSLRLKLPLTPPLAPLHNGKRTVTCDWKYVSISLAKEHSAWR